MTERQYAVAIDGPSGAGKSTLARAAAEALHILYVDTGAIYRTIGVYMYRHDIAPTDAPAVIAALPEITVALRYDEEGLQRMYLNGEDVTKEIRLPMISKYASDVSAIPEVRAFLMELDPLYCDVIVQRWEKFTGRKAARVGSSAVAEEKAATRVAAGSKA